jgi:hypothetical protein
MTPRQIARGALRCSLFPAATRPFLALLKMESTKDRVGVIRLEVERSMIDGRAPSKQIPFSANNLHPSEVAGVGLTFDFLKKASI